MDSLRTLEPPTADNYSLLWKTRLGDPQRAHLKLWRGDEALAELPLSLRGIDELIGILQDWRPILEKHAVFRPELDDYVYVITEGARA